MIPLETWVRVVQRAILDTVELETGTRPTPPEVWYGTFAAKRRDAPFSGRDHVKVTFRDDIITDDDTLSEVLWNDPDVSFRDIGIGEEALVKGYRSIVFRL